MILSGDERVAGRGNGEPDNENVSDFKYMYLLKSNVKDLSIIMDTIVNIHVHVYTLDYIVPDDPGQIDLYVSMLITQLKFLHISISRLVHKCHCFSIWASSQCSVASGNYQASGLYVGT